MITTSYYAYQYLPLVGNLVSISCTVNEGAIRMLKGREFRHYKKLSPPWPIVDALHKRTITHQQYAAIYQNQILSKLDPNEVYNELGEDPILLCYEHSKQFCHRHLAAKWLSKSLDIQIHELDLSPTKLIMDNAWGM